MSEPYIHAMLVIMGGDDSGFVKLVAEWSYEPSGFLREELVLELRPWKVRVGGGKVAAEYIDRPIPEDVDTDEIGRQIEAALRGLQIHQQRSVVLRGPGITREKNDGSVNVVVHAESIHLRVAVRDAVDVVVKDKDGNVISDSVAERVKRLSDIGNLSAVYHEDPTLQKLLDSYTVAVNHPDRQIAHLFELVEHLEQRFGSRESAKKTLGKDAANAITFIGKLANNEPIVEGRHPGKHSVALRKMTREERDRALDGAQVLIEAYLGHLAK